MADNKDETKIPLAIRPSDLPVSPQSGKPVASKAEMEKPEECLIPKHAHPYGTLAVISDSLVSTIDKCDPGDETQRNFRYQACLGAMLLIAMKAKALGYRAIWCEQREDFLAEIDHRTYDAYQVKTASPAELWHLKSEAFRTSVRRFLLLDADFPNRVQRFVFYSNAGYLDSNAKHQKRRSIPRLLEAVSKIADVSKLDAEAKKAFDTFLSDLNKDSETVWTTEALLSVMKRMVLEQGPSRDEFHALLCHSHLSKVTEFANASSKELNHAVEALVARVLLASSLHTTSASRHYAAVLVAKGGTEPQLISKRLTLDDFDIIVAERQTPAFRYLSTLTTLRLGTQRDEAEDSRRRKLKMERGGLGLYVDLLQRQALSAERRLLDLATRTECGGEVYAQFENVVRSEVELARMEIETSKIPYGKKMLLRTEERFKAILKNEPQRVYSEGVDMLWGVAGLLTGQCLVWWSDKFEIEVAA